MSIKPSRSFGLKTNLLARLGGSHTLTVGELLGFALGVIVIFNVGGFVPLPPEARIVLGLFLILLTETAF